VQDPRPDRGGVVVELRAAALNRRDLLVRRGLILPPPPDPRLRRVGHPPRHAGGGDHSSVAELGRRRRSIGVQLRDPRRTARRNVCGARRRPGGERLPEAATTLLGRSSGASAGRTDVLQGAVRVPRRCGRRDGTRSRSGKRRLHICDSACLPCCGPRACDELRPEKIELACQLGASGGVLYTEPDWVANVQELAGAPSTSCSTPSDPRGRTRSGPYDPAAVWSCSVQPGAPAPSSTCDTSTSATSHCWAPPWAPRAISKPCFGLWPRAPVRRSSTRPGHSPMPSARRIGSRAPTTSARSSFALRSISPPRDRSVLRVIRPRRRHSTTTTGQLRYRSQARDPGADQPGTAGTSRRGGRAPAHALGRIRARVRAR
jgi:hypothetical protein